MKMFVKRFNGFIPEQKCKGDQVFLAVFEMLSNKGKASTCNTERQKIEVDPMAVLADSKDKKNLVFFRYYCFLGVFFQSVKPKKEGH
jgi:hypothetical protein